MACRGTPKISVIDGLRLCAPGRARCARPGDLDMPAFRSAGTERRAKGESARTPRSAAPEQGRAPLGGWTRYSAAGGCHFQAAHLVSALVVHAASPLIVSTTL